MSLIITGFIDSNVMFLKGHEKEGASFSTDMLSVHFKLLFILIMTMKIVFQFTKDGGKDIEILILI